MTRRIPLVLAVAALSLSALPLDPRAAGPDISDVVSGAFAKVRIAIPEAETSAGFAGPSSELIETLRADLDYSGLFSIVDPTLYRNVPKAKGGALSAADWRSLGADAVTQIRIPVEDDRIDIEARLHDTTSAKVVFAKRYGGTREVLRRVAHQLADDLVRHYTGRPGVAMSRIAFVSEHGKGKEIYLMDYDGRRVRRLTTTETINLSPAWSPSGNELAFVSWRGKQPGVYVMSSEGKLGLLRTIGGELSSAPDWSPDGTRLAYSSDADGNTEIYVLDRGSGKNRRLTHDQAIDTAPAFSPNGREIAFTSDRSGTPQIYVMDAEGLNVRRISHDGSYNESAAWSPDGERLAWTTRIDGKFQIVVLDLNKDLTKILTRGSWNHESPRWSPDGRHLVFASNRDGAYQIYTIRADGSDIQRMTQGPASFTPDWSK
jgi:TolB protein